MAAVVCDVEEIDRVRECQVGTWTAKIVLQAVKGTEVGPTKTHASLVAQIISLRNDCMKLCVYMNIGLVFLTKFIQNYRYNC